MGLTMPQIPQCKGLCALRRLFDELYWTVSYYLPDILYRPATDPASPSRETYQCDGEGEHQQTCVALISSLNVFLRQMVMRRTRQNTALLPFTNGRLAFPKRALIMSVNLCKVAAQVF